MTQPKLNWPQLYLCVALTTGGTLLLELSLTRIFSVVFYYHFAFLAISIALFGLGAGGVLSYVLAGRSGLFHILGRLSAGNSLLVLLAAAVVLSQKDEPEGAGLLVLYLVIALPFLVAGTIISLAISESVERVGRVYFFDLLGAACGCLLLVPLLNYLNGPNTTVGAAILFAAAAAIWHNMAGSASGRAGSVALALALVALIIVNFSTKILDVRYAKGQKIANELWVKWNPISRIAIVQKEWGKEIIIDADASTGIANFDFENLPEKDRHDLLFQGPGLPYNIRPGAKTLIIGPGGGWDVARALAGSAKDITGVEINPLIANDIMRRRFPQYSRSIYSRPEVRVFVEDGRAFVRRSAEKYQVLQATLVDTWASTAAGAFALSENNLYTTEAFHDYLSHLTDDGMFACTRWGFDPPRESLRLISLAIDALGRLGEREPFRHVIVGREGSVSGWGARDTVLISRKPFTAEDIGRARGALAESKMTAVYLPDERIPNPFTELLRSPDPAAYQRAYRYDITPVGDDRPFFFYTVQPADILTFLSSARKDTADYKINRAIPLLFRLVVVSLIAVLIILALPPVVLGTRLPREPGVLRFLLYFLFIGTGYILIEVALIQKFVLFLGHPTYALTVVIFSMLVASGLGSYWSARVIAGTTRRWRMVLIAVAGLIGLLAAVVTPLLTAGVGWPLGVKAVATIALLFPAGFVMGIPFPTGLARLESWHKPSVRWAWSLNAASSVLGSVMAIVLAIYLGLTLTLLAGGALYLAAVWASYRYRAAGTP
jgi:hypothetical protein